MFMDTKEMYREYFYKISQTLELWQRENEDICYDCFVNALSKLKPRILLKQFDKKQFKCSVILRKNSICQKCKVAEV